MLNEHSVLVTGGTGSFGQKFIENIINRYPRVRRVVVFSRDEHKQFDMAQRFPVEKYEQLRYFIGDVRDKDRLYRAMERIDVVVHAAALKHVPTAEYNPFETIKTNIIGAQNVIEVCLERDVKKVVALSTDKAAGPINLYGATKLCSDKLFIAANSFKGLRDLKFSVVRYGNVMGSRGSVIPFFLEKRDKGILPVTDERMTRFNITLQEGVDFVLKCLERMWGGEIFVPKIPSFRITDLAEAVCPGCRTEVVGIRPGEKLHEEMITETDALSSLEFDDHYVILPALQFMDADEYMKKNGGRLCPDGFRYNSGTNSEWLTVNQIRELIRENCDPHFEV
ncbi:MAG: UDP-N-acetylglucosamine 4,6-dehydratase (inverting) [bacterium]|nr:MAG: UDP-N-acetylglucosamine 4,6-dehydratase (inverting) [bacterium]